jgi:hypothetical protein
LETHLPNRVGISRGRLGAALVFVLALLVYARTLAPSITWRNTGADSGDLVTAAWVGGVPHPPGYPLYTLLAQFFTLLPWGEVANRVNWLSALSAASATLMVYLVALTLQSLRGVKNPFFAAASALVLAFSPLFWSQATIAEVYALHAFLFTLTLGSFLLWAFSQELGSNVSPRLIAWVPMASGLALGLSLAHHLTIVLILPGVLILAWQKIPFRRLGLALGLAILVAGLGYLTLSLRAAADPPVNWGNPQTLGNLGWIISGQAYRGYLLGVPLIDYPARLGDWARLLLAQFGWVGVALGLAGAMDLQSRARRLGTAFLATFLLYVFFATTYASIDAFVYLLPAWIIFALWIAGGLGGLLEQVSQRVSLAHFSKQQWAWVIGAVSLLLPLRNLIGNWATVDLSQDTVAIDYAHQVFASVPDGAMVVAEGDEHIFALWYSRYVEKPESHVTIVAKGLLVYPWYREQLARQHPEWSWPGFEGLEWSQYLRLLVQSNLSAHPIYWTETDSYFANFFQFRSAGLLYQVSPATTLP